MKISIIGLGYVGLPLACAIVKKTKHKVIGFDVSHEKIQKISKGFCPIDDFLCEQDLKEVKFEVSSNPEILANSDIYIVCVPTPVLNNFTPDLKPIITVTEIIAKYLEKGQVVIVESTINPGVCEEVIIPILEEKSGFIAGTDFDVAHCPERINPGDPKWNVYNIPRNIGSTSKETTHKIAELYRSFVDAEINEMPDLKTAEATKIIENTFRDINIAYVNELAKSFDILGIDLMTVIKGASNKPFAFMPHYPGCGVGGHCIPVDPYYLITRAGLSGFNHKYLKLAREINNSMPSYTVKLLANALNQFEKSIKGTKIGLLGISYKANVGDIRESPALKIKSILEKKDAKLEIYDPYISDISTCKSLDEILHNSFALLIATDHREFKEISVKQLLDNDIKIIIDGRNCFDKKGIIESGIYYKGIV